MHSQTKQKFAKLLLLLSMISVAGHALAAKPTGRTAATKQSSESGIHMYRYTNDKGVVVTGNTIEPEYARKGYQIVTLSGQVLETIPPEPTAEDRARIAQDAQNKVSAAQQVEKDKQLLLRYSTVDEIQFAKKRKLSEIENKIVLLNSNVATLESQITVEQQRAATFERNGQSIPPALLKKIDDLQQALKVTESQVVSRKQELADETVRFDADIERLTILDKNRPKH
jgi:hypothetical protein